MKSFIKMFWWDLVLGIALLQAESIRWFLFFLFLNILFVLAHLGKHLRISNILNNLQTTAIVRKLKITDDEMGIVLDSIRSKMDPSQWKSIEEDIKDLSSNK